jgi:chitodextrinase
MPAPSTPRKWSRLLLVVVVTVVALLPSVAAAGPRRPPRDTTPPTTPSNVRLVSIDDLQLALTWNASSDDSGRVEYQVEQDGICCWWRSSNSFQWGTATPGETYTFRVRAIDPSSNMSAFSAPLSVTVPEDVTPPASPTNLRATDVAVTKVSLAWDGGEDETGVSFFRVFVDGVPLPGPIWNTKTALASGLSPDTGYRFQVVAVDVAGNQSAPSDELVVRTDATSDAEPPTAPVITFASNNWDCEVNLRFTLATDNVDPQSAITYEMWLDGVRNESVFVGLTEGRVTFYGLEDLQNVPVFIRAIDTSGNFADSQPRTVDVTC